MKPVAITYVYAYNDPEPSNEYYSFDTPRLASEESLNLGDDSYDEAEQSEYGIAISDEESKEEESEEYERPILFSVSSFVDVNEWVKYVSTERTRGVIILSMSIITLSLYLLFRTYVFLFRVEQQ